MEVKFIENPSAPGAKQEMERLRAENAALKRRLGDGGGGVLFTEEEMQGEFTSQQIAEQPRTFLSGNCTITIVPLSQMPPLKMNPDFGGITIRGQEAIAVSRVGKKKATTQEPTIQKQKIGPATSHAEAEIEEDDAMLRFQLIELK